MCELSQGSAERLSKVCVVHRCVPVECMKRLEEDDRCASLRQISQWMGLAFWGSGPASQWVLEICLLCFPVLGLQTYLAIVGFLCGCWGFEFCSSCFAYWAIFSVPQIFYLKKIFFNCLNYVKSDSGVTWFHIHYWSIYVTVCSVFYSSNTQRQVYPSEILQGRDVVEGRSVWLCCRSDPGS